jgi:hypothetical protein
MRRNLEYYSRSAITQDEQSHQKGAGAVCEGSCLFKQPLHDFALGMRRVVQAMCFREKDQLII